MLTGTPLMREISAPVTKEQLRPLDPRCVCVQFSQPLSQAELQALAEFMRQYPNKKLRIYGHHHENRMDLEFLQFFPFLKRFQVDVHCLENLDGLRFLPKDLESLSLGATKRKNVSLRILEQFDSLKDLDLEGHTKDISSVGRLLDLERLSLRSVTIEDLSFLLPLRKLECLEIRLGGTNDLHLVPQVGHIKYLELWLIRGFSDLSFVEDMRDLRCLFLQSLKDVRSLPKFDRLHNLRRVYIEQLKGLTDLTPLCSAPALEELSLIDMPQLRTSDIAPLKGHQTLTNVNIGTGSFKRNAEMKQLLGLPDAGHIRAEDKKPTYLLENSGAPE